LELVGGVIAVNLTNLDAIIGENAIVSLIPLNIRGCDGSPVRAFATTKVNIPPGPALRLFLLTHLALSFIGHHLTVELHCEGLNLALNSGDIR
jgi:hypothetical protein